MNGQNHIKFTVQFSFQSKVFFVFLVEKLCAVGWDGAGGCAGRSISWQTRTNCRSFYSKVGESLAADWRLHNVKERKGKETALQRRKKN